MSELHLPWLAASLVFSLLGAAWVACVRDPRLARQWSLIFSGLTLLTAVGAWLDFDLLATNEAIGYGHLQTQWFGREFFVIDRLSAPLLPLVALLHFLTALTTLNTKVRRFSFVSALISEAILLATICCREPWIVIGLLAAGTVRPYLDLRTRGQPTRVYVIYMAAYVLLMVAGWSIVEMEGQDQAHSLWAVVPLLVAVFIRSGIAPFHSWMLDLFDRSTLGSALLFVAPLTGAYAAVRLLLPIAPDWVLRSIGLVSLFTAVYAAGMALIQRDARRFFCFLFLSHSALVLVGLEMGTPRLSSPIGLTGGLCVWLSIGLSLGGFGLTLRALEARRGRLKLTEFQGLYEHTPTLAVCFLLTGLGSVGFPGTLGFVGTEMLIDGAVETYPYIGVAVVIAAALNGIAVVQAYFRLFTGTRYSSSVSLQIGERERFGVLLLAALILIGGIFPQQGILSRYRAAEELRQQHTEDANETTSSEPEQGHKH
ncbi:MAG: proton-conducting transporter membrane subunit [Planctomycetota bacterium]